MLSVILYGRNDNHGYNLHKRAAISVNAIAEVLSDPDDELLFVDYNTPDDHATFPEAISDTLTDKAKKVLRIFRVRPKQHAHWKQRTHLVALEPQSRNIALRRSNPRNRWILYTNTDMLFVPRDERRSLSDILAALPDGFYQVPRFELPEILWETAFDRRDPIGNLAKLRGWSMQFHLNQVVHNALPMRYEALGDFQASLREDMFAIHGFNEAMLHGWHCDSNLAARLTLYRGSADTLADKVFAYHCDHTRVAAANNMGRQTTMNDQERFIWNVTTPFLSEQAKNWGSPHAEIEEIRLDNDSNYRRFTAGVSAATGPAKEPFRTTNAEPHLYYDLTYDLRHTIPFVCDQVLTYPRSVSIAIVATRAEFITYFAKAWSAMGFSNSILVPAECNGLLADLPGVETIPFTDVLARADMFVFEFGLTSQGINDPVRTGRRPSAHDGERLGIVERLFRRAVAFETKDRPKGRQQRRFIGVNVIYTKFWSVFTDHIATNISPFSSQVLAGYPHKADSWRGTLRRLLGR